MKTSEFLMKCFLISTVSVSIVGCAHKADQQKTPKAEVEQPARNYPNNTSAPLNELREEAGNHVVSTVKFSKGNSELNSEARAELEKAVRLAQNTGEVDEITIAVWSDNEFPVQGESLPQEQVALANKRGAVIQDYLEDQLDIDEVEILNMAKHPNALSRYFKTDEAQKKQELASAGINKTSAAMIMVHAD